MNVPDGYEGLLTKGKIYQGLENERFYYSVHNDRLGNKDTYLKYNLGESTFIPPWVIFITLEQYRNLQIKKLLNNVHI